MKKTPEQISYNMKQVKNKDSEIELLLRREIWRRGYRYRKNTTKILGKPDIVFLRKKVAVFVDGEFWHGYLWDRKYAEIKSHNDFWISKIEDNIRRDARVNRKLTDQGWTVLRFWGEDIKRNVNECADKIEAVLVGKQSPFKTIDLCAGIGGIRRGFERTGYFENVLSAEIDPFACETYKHLYNQDAFHDLTDERFKLYLERTQYDVLLAGFPCQTFSRAGNEEGFSDKSKGIIFNHIADIIGRTRPKAIFLENVDNLTKHDCGKTFDRIIETLEIDLDYKIIGVVRPKPDLLFYKGKNFIRNSKYFGIPQNRPRTYIMGFNRRISGKLVDDLPNRLPERDKRQIFKDLNEVLELGAPARYYMSSGYLRTLEKHKEREKKKGNGFGYKIVNAPDIEEPIANTILATGGSGKERNLVLDPQPGIENIEVKTKKTKLNCKGIRVMTSREWGKLQGFIGYGFIDSDGNDRFSFPDTISEHQRYKLFGNAVTIPVIETMAEFMFRCFQLLDNTSSQNT